MIREKIVRMMDERSLTHAPSGLNLGTKLKNVIETVVDIAPLSKRTKEKIKSCGTCGQTAKALDKL